MTNICLVCKKNPAETSSRFGALPCTSCRQKQHKKVGKINRVEFASASKTDRIGMDRLMNEHGMVQPWDINGKPNSEFVKIYKEKALDYFSLSELEKL